MPQDLFGHVPEEEPSRIPQERTTDDLQAIARAMALLWTWRPRNACHEVLRHWGLRSSSGKAFTHASVKLGLEELKRAGQLVEHPHRPGFWRLTDEVRAPLYRHLLEEVPIRTLREVLYRAERFDLHQPSYRWPVWDQAATIGIVRLEILAGTPTAKLAELRRQVSMGNDWNEVVWHACVEAFDAASFERIAPDLRWDIAFAAIDALTSAWQAERLPVLEWLLGKLDMPPRDGPLPDHLRLQAAEALLHRGEPARALALVADLTDGASDAIRAGALVQEGRWAEAQQTFEVALKKRQAEVNARKRVLPASIAWLYPLALLAQPTPKHLESAKRFCLGEAGSRDPNPYHSWGLWTHAISARLGDGRLEPQVFEIAAPAQPSWSELWRCLLRAWLGAEAIGTARGAARNARGKAVATLRERLRACGFGWLDTQVAAAESAFAGGDVPANFFVSGDQESWRDVLAALEALGGETKAQSDAAAARILWSIRLDRQGGVEEIEPLEQKRGARGWSKPKPLPLGRLAGNHKLEPWDARVARALLQERYSGRRHRLDRAAAIVALIGHPGVVLADAPETTVDVVEGTPELEVVREGERFELRIRPLPRQPREDDEVPFFSADARREEEALRCISVVRDSPQRIRVIRFTPAQRRAAQLVSGRFSVPAAAQTELQQALQSLAGHFHIESDHARAAREVAAETRLRAELAPTGESLMLRLVAAPLGPDGPRLMPGSGRARVMAAVKGEAIGTERDLGAERGHLEAVLAAFEFLDPPGRGDVVCEWLVDEPERALALVEGLPKLEAIGAVDWPRGQAVRVLTVDPARVALTVSTERDWFRVSGRVHLDESLVLELQALLDAAAGRSRFVPMGKGVYAALTRELREKLAELAAVAEAHGGALRVPPLAAPWLKEVLEGTAAQSDAGFVAQVERLRSAQATTSAVPGGLQTTLRPYQEDGYQWAMRLSQAGFGACLADDMGLGKTIQTLSVLLARASGGPSLVVAPTSVCGNWLAEAQRFAPALNAALYGEGGRAALIEAAGPRDVVIVSYALMQQAQETFAARTWHTLVADEAQAIKNAAAKRSLALFDLKADFRMALSGTPIENRLAELWSIMRFCNPGLLGPVARFNERFAGPIERDRDRDAQRMLRRLIAPFVLRRTKSQVLEELPSRTELVLAITPEAAEAAHYEALRRAAVATAESAAATEPGGQAQLHILAQLTRLRRAACDPRLVTPEMNLAGSKVRAFSDLVAELTANGHKALVFSQFVDFLALLREPLDAAGLRYQYLDGATPAAERSRRVAAFQSGEGDLFLISLKAGGFGLNLTAADYVVITDPWWNPAAEDQAMGRAHRIGQARPVTVYRLVTSGTLEERIVALHHEKRALAEGVLSESMDTAALPSTTELIELMRGT